MNIHQRAQEILREDPTQRIGQAYYNAVRFESDWLARVIDGTERDPFNNNAALPAFLEAWYEAWGGDGANLSPEAASLYGRVNPDLAAPWVGGVES